MNRIKIIVLENTIKNFIRQYKLLHDLWNIIDDNADLEELNLLCVTLSKLKVESYYPFVQEIRENLVFLEQPEVIRYKQYLMKFVSDYSDEFTILNSVFDYKKEKLDESELHPWPPFENLNHIIHYFRVAIKDFLVEWNDFSNIINTEIQTDFEILDNMKQNDFDTFSDDFSTSVKPNDKLTYKQQVLLLNKLGILNTPSFVSLTTKNKGILWGYILNRHNKNIEESIRNINTTQNMVSMDKYFMKSDKDVSKVNMVLKEVGLENL